MMVMPGFAASSPGISAFHCCWNDDDAALRAASYAGLPWVAGMLPSGGRSAQTKYLPPAFARAVISAARLVMASFVAVCSVKGLASRRSFAPPHSTYSALAGEEGLEPRY